MKRNLLLTLLLAVYFCANTQTITPPSLWFRTTAETSYLVNKSDSSFFTSIPLSYIPTQAYVNGYPSLVLDSLNYLGYTTTALNKNKQLNVLIAFQKVQTNSKMGVWSLRNTAEKSYFITSETIGRGTKRLPHFFSDDQNVVVNSSSFTFEKNTSASNTDTIYIGNADSLLLKGAVAEFIVLKDNTTPNERKQWQSYLSLKYSASMFRDNYFDSQNDTLWNYKTNEYYSKGIAGIGRDDFFELNQHQSRIQNDSVSIGIDRICNIQSNHTPVLNNQDFILWGHNGATLNSDGLFYYYQDSIPFELSARKWKIVPRITSDTIYTFALLRDASDIQNPQQLCLLVSPTAEFESWPERVSLYIPDSIIDNKIYYSNIHWDSDGDGKDYFTFGKPANSKASVLFESVSNIPTNVPETIFTQASWQPNPVTDNLTINYTLTRQATIGFTVHTNGGIAVCQTAPAVKQAGHNQTSIPMGHLITGAYTVYVHIDNMLIQHTIIKK